MNRSDHCADSEAGFTLLELLIAMTLLAFLMTMLLGGLRFGVRAWERTGATSAQADEVLLSQTWLRRELSVAYPAYISVGTHSRVDFSGLSNEMKFLAPAAQGSSDGGRSRITLRAVEHEGAFSLIVEQRPELLSAVIADSPPEELLRHLTRLEFAYFGSITRNEVPQWHDRWIGQSALPTLIRIRGSFPPDRRVDWPELTVTTRISSDVGCIYDILTNACRGR